ncbi:MAG: DinB family protein [Candidatus Acidiferrales bacterium]
MYQRVAQVMCVLAIVAVIAMMASAQGQQAPPTFEQAVVRQFNNIHNKVITMAKDFPEDKFDARPSKETRSFIEEVWHLTQTAEFGAAIFRGEKPDPQKFFGSYEGRPRARAELVAQLEKAVKEAGGLLEQKPTPRAIGLIEHAGEHYGKMATIYRLNNLVPPASRPRQ